MVGKLFRSKPLLRVLFLTWIVPVTMACGDFSCSGEPEDCDEYGCERDPLTLVDSTASEAFQPETAMVSDENGARGAFVSLIRQSPRMKGVYTELSDRGCRVEFEDGRVYEPKSPEDNGATAIVPITCEDEHQGALRVDVGGRITLAPVAASAHFRMPW